MIRITVQTFFSCLLLICIPLTATAAESTLEKIEKDVDKVTERLEERLEETDVPCGWWYFENGVRRHSAGTEISDAQAKGELGYFQCQGACPKNSCSAAKSPLKPGIWECRCR